MDARQFDTLARSLTDSRSRRGVLAAVFGGALGVATLTETEAKKKCPPCKKRKQGKCKKQLPDGTPCTGGSCRNGQCCVPACGDRLCGDDGCGGASCGYCSSGLVCSAGQCVFGNLAPGDACNPDLPLACSSGFCGCVTVPSYSCTCRSETCGMAGTACTTATECCSSDCFNLGLLGHQCG